jgi:small subunit ribosomal protein S3
LKRKTIQNSLKKITALDLT